jgi:hypothetical protein
MSDAARFAQTQPAPAPTTAPSPNQAAADESIGNVATLTGRATVTRNNASTPLKLQDDILLDDVLETSANSTLGVTFNDATTFNLTANAKITVDNFVYEDGGKQNAAQFDIAKGTVAFVAAAVAKTGDMKISTPTATLGIRGTTGLVEVPEGASAASANNVAIKLYPDPDGRVGRIEVNGRDGARLGFLTQGASGFTIRPGAGGRLAALPLVISPQQALRDQGFVRQVHAAQSVGARSSPSGATNACKIRSETIQPIRRAGPVSRDRMVCRRGPVLGSSPRCRADQDNNCNNSRPACSDPDWKTGPRCRSRGQPCRLPGENRQRKDVRADATAIHK